jgi:serine/threonine protein phosphatase PrpC
MTLRVRAGAATDVGRVRSVNQDSFLVLADKGLFVVADGMGGHQGGEVASRMAVDVLQSTYVESSADALAEAISDANERIHDVGDADPDLRGMGTTIVAAAVVPDADGGDGAEGAQLLVANVGDSRAYLFRDGDLTQLTEDHSMVADLLREGRISEEEAEVHPQRNIVTRVLGVYDQVDIDLWPVDAVRGDRLLLCSDGLFNEVAADQIAAVLRRLADPQEAASELVRRANEGGGRDNVTVLVLDVVDDGGVAESASAALADEPTGLAAATGPDLAGRGAGTDDPRPSARHGRAKRRRDRRAEEPRARRITWRAVLFAIAVVAVIAGAFATIEWYGTSTYFVGFHGREVAIFHGRPGGVLWIDPTLERDTGVTRADVPARYLEALKDGSEQASLTDAKRYVSNIKRDIAATTTTTTTTTTVPPVAPVTTPP